MINSINGICSMATRGLLEELAASYSQRSGISVSFAATGGVDAARRVHAGEFFDLVVLASDAIDKLIDAGKAEPASRVDLVRSCVGVSVRSGVALPDISTGAALRQAVLAASSVGYSTGPSGVALINLFNRWGISEGIHGRLVQAPPGVPVGSLVARGEVALGFQQISELIGIEGIQLVGPLSPDVQIQTIFSAALLPGSMQADAVRALLGFMTSEDSADAMRRHGMEPA